MEWEKIRNLEDCGKDDIVVKNEIDLHYYRLMKWVPVYEGTKELQPVTRFM